jgi:hypothetical protein
MWDFDDTDIGAVIEALEEIKNYHCLPRIYILESNPGISYMAYSFTSLPFNEAVAIIAQTRYEDWQHFKLSVLRGYFTLRMSEKRGYEPRLIRILESLHPEQASIAQLTKFVQYETSKTK